MKKTIFTISILICLSACRSSNPFKYNNHLDLAYMIKLYQDNGYKTTNEYRPAVPKTLYVDGTLAMQVGSRFLVFYKLNADSPDALKTLKRVKKNGFIKIMALTRKAVVNGSFIMWGFEGHEDEDKIVKIFKDFNLDVIY